MKKIIQLGVLIITIFSLTGCKKNYMSEISYEEFHQLLENKETFILEIMRTECTACKDFKPKLTKVLEEYQIEIKYINTDHLTEEEKDSLYKETNISGTPTVIFYTDGETGSISSRINGSVSVEKIISKMKANGFIPEEKEQVNEEETNQKNEEKTSE